MKRAKNEHINPVNIPAPVPPAEQPDLTKMVERIADQIANSYYHDPGRTLHEFLDDAEAILLRHLQPLAEQVAGLQARVDAAERERDQAQRDYESCSSALYHTRMTAVDAMNEIRKAAGALPGHEDKSSKRAVDYVADLRAQLTAAQEELSSTVKAFESFQEQSWATRDQLQTQLTALQSALAQKEKDGERLRHLAFLCVGNSQTSAGIQWSSFKALIGPGYTLEDAIDQDIARRAARTARSEGDKT